MYTLLNPKIGYMIIGYKNVYTFIGYNSISSAVIQCIMIMFSFLFNLFSKLINALFFKV